MRSNPSRPRRSASERAGAWLFTAASAVLLAACASSDSIVTPQSPSATRHDVAATSTSGVVISQVYGGGGNSGASYRNDFIELYNASSTTVSLAGWSVQYASSSGTSWQVTPLTGEIAPGGYYLVQESAGAGGTVALPTPDASGGINMSATAGKVALVRTTTALTGSAAGTAPLGGTACPSCVADVVDFVGFGSGTSCFEGSGPTASLSNTTAALRKTGGAQDTNDNAADFATGAPTPHNTGFTAPVAGPVASVAVSPASTTVSAGQTRTFTAAAKDANGTAASTTITWSSSDPAVASIDAATGVATGKVPGTVTITATAANEVAGSATLTVTAGNVSVSARTVPLPVGFQTQLFASGTDQSGSSVSGQTVTWSSSDPGVLTVDGRGVVTAVGVGSARIRATLPDGAFGETTVQTESQLFSATARAGHNTEFGTPNDADPSDDVIIARKEYTLSYNPTRGGPNWVSWDLSATHLGSADRCNCFTADTALTRLGYPAYTTADFITGGLYDRGHMEPSADQSTTDTENATTFFLSNILPQTHDLNAGPWERLETALRDSAKAGREVYVIAGGVFTNGVGLGSLNGLGRIFIPDSTWKIAVIVPAGSGLGDVHAPGDVTVLAVNMPNVTGIAGNAWQQYLTTVDRIERSTGYDFLAALPDDVESLVESGSAGVRVVDMDVQPQQISVFSTAVVNVVLLSSASFDAAAVNAADLRLVVNGGAEVAPIVRGTTVNTSVRDVDGDGRPDRVIGFSVAALRAAGLAPGASSLVLRPAGGAGGWEARDATPPTVVP